MKNDTVFINNWGGYSNQETLAMVLHQQNNEEIFDQVALFLINENTDNLASAAFNLQTAWKVWMSEKYWIDYGSGYVPQWLYTLRSEIKDFSRVNWLQVVDSFLENRE